MSCDGGRDRDPAGPRPGKPGPKPREGSTTDAPVVRLRVPREILRELDAVARREGRSRPAAIRAALREGLASGGLPAALRLEAPTRRKPS